MVLGISRQCATASVALATTLAVAGCGPVTGAASTPSAHVPVASHVNERGINVEGTEVRIAGANVSTACFDFTTPDIGAEWVLHPEASACMSDVNWPDSDQLTMVIVRAETGENFPGTLEEGLVEAGATIAASWETVVDGQPTQVVDTVDEMGFTHRGYLVALPEGRFHRGGRALTAIYVGGYVDGGEFAELLERLVHSIDIH